MKLKPRTSYRTVGGNIVHIAGHAVHPTFEGQTLFWSINGHWYAEDGRAFLGRVRYRPGQPIEMTRFLADPGHYDSIEKEEHDPTWWVGVET